MPQLTVIKAKKKQENKQSSQHLHSIYYNHISSISTAMQDIKKPSISDQSKI